MGCSSVSTKENIKNTRKEIIKYEAKTSLIEDQISNKKKQLGDAKLNSIKKEELKNDLYCTIKKYKRYFNYLRLLKNNLEVMEKQGEEKKIVNVLDNNNRALKELNEDRNADIINDNLNRIRNLNEQLEYNEKLLEIEDKIDNSPQGKKERDAFIKEFFKNQK
jgi:hypothetical protein